MGDDFDLFPKRENLDPFSFGKKEKTTDSDKPDGEEDLFGQEEPALGPLPDLSSTTPEGPAEITPPIPDLPPGDSAEVEPSSGFEMPPLQPPPSPVPPQPEAAVPDLMDGILSDGPISEEKTFDEPVFDQEQVLDEPVERSSRRPFSPFVVIGGALIIIIVLLYGALTYLKRDKAPMPAVPIPPVSVAVTPLKPEPAPEPENVITEVKAETPPGGETIQPVETKVNTPVDTEVTPTETVPETAPVIIKPTSKPEPTLETDAVAAGSVQYSLQMGAFILDSSVAELEKKLRGLGYEPFRKKGSTTAMMNMLTVGPFSNVNDARTALAQLKEAGVDSNLRRRGDGGAIINAGSYLLEENATSIMKKIRSMGYPVKLLRREARLPMTFVRVGRYPDRDGAAIAKQELMDKGLEGVVVKLQ